MANEETCIDCKAALTEVQRPQYRVKATGKTICPLPRCPNCRVEYEKVRIGPGKGLELIVASILMLLSLVSLAGCAPYGPWPFSTEEQRERLLTRPGQTVAQVQERNGAAHVDQNSNPSSRDSFQRLPDNFTGIAYFQLRNCSVSSDEAIQFDGGVAVKVWYVRNPWAGYDTWQLHELVWDK